MENRKYTGVKDKNGNKIHEGDIVTVDIYSREEDIRKSEYLRTSICPIEFRHGSFGFYEYYFHTFYSYLSYELKRLNTRKFCGDFLDKAPSIIKGISIYQGED